MYLPVDGISSDLWLVGKNTLVELFYLQWWWWSVVFLSIFTCFAQGWVKVLIVNIVSDSHEFLVLRFKVKKIVYALLVMRFIEGLPYKSSKARPQ